MLKYKIPQIVTLTLDNNNEASNGAHKIKVGR